MASAIKELVPKAASAVKEAVPKAASAGAELLAETREWFQENGFFCLASALIHGFFFACVALVSTYVPVAWEDWKGGETTAELAPAEVESEPPAPIERFEVGNAPLEPTELTTETLLQTTPLGQTAQHYDESPDFEEAGGGTPTPLKGPMVGGLGGFRVEGLWGPGGRGGVGSSDGTGELLGTGGSGLGFGGRGAGHRDALVGAFGGTKASERAVGAALNWLHRHQNPGGNWSLQHSRHCTGRTCGGAGWVKADAAATGLALLPFLGAGQTHKSTGPYRQTIQKGVFWLVKHQGSDGNLAAGAEQPMYSHGIATIALCEAYGMTKDEFVGAAARKAVVFIQQAQNPQTGGWRYTPGDPGDTSVLGWQVMALKSAQLAGIGVDTNCLESSRKWLNSVAKGEHGGLFSYIPYKEVTPTMTSVGLLCFQYLGDDRDDPRMIEGRQYLLQNLPDNGSMRNSYYWYYGTLVMHNFLGPQWDAWNRQMRRVLIESQEREGCATGSWDPENPTTDTWGPQGGRLLTTCFATLTLEVYYRYLPLFQFSSPQQRQGGTE